MREKRALTIFLAFSAALLFGVGCQDDDNVGPAPNYADLSITKSDGVLGYTAGESVTYTIVVSNAGPMDAIGASIADLATATPQVQSAIWTCVGAGGATCTAGPAAGDIIDVVDLPNGGTLTYTLVVTTKTDATGNLVNTAGVTAPDGITDPGPGANTATDTDTSGTPPDLAGQYSLAITGGSDACGYIGTGTNPLPIVIAQSFDRGSLTSGDWSPGYGLCGVVSEGPIGIDSTFSAAGQKTYLDFFDVGCGLAESHEWSLTFSEDGQVAGTWTLGLHDSPMGCAGLGACTSVLDVNGPSCASCWNCNPLPFGPTPERARTFIEKMKR